MTIPLVGTTGTTGTPTDTTTSAKKTLDSEVFMQLLVTQLKNQDPSSPLDTNGMISQTTQLAMMESLTSLNSLGQEGFGLNMRSAAAAYLGKQVTYAGADGAEVTGTVSAVSFSGSVPTVTVGGTQVALDALTGVAEPAA